MAKLIILIKKTTWKAISDKFRDEKCHLATAKTIFVKFSQALENEAIASRVVKVTNSLFVGFRSAQNNEDLSVCGAVLMINLRRLCNRIEFLIDNQLAVTFLYSNEEFHRTFFFWTRDFSRS
jgi:hypothetical protein